MIIIGDDKFAKSLEVYVEDFQSQHIGIDIFEFAQVEYGQLAIISDRCLHEVSDSSREKLIKLPAIIVYQETENELPFYLPNFVLKFNPQNNKSLLLNNIHLWERQLRQEEFMRSHFVSLQQEIISMTEDMNSQMSKIKKIYDIQIPMRSLKLKGLEIISKYSVGSDRDSEYFDFLKTENKVYIFMTHTNSYLTSALLMKLFQEEKEKTLWDQAQVKQFLKKIQSEASELATHKKEKIETQIFLAELDLKSYELSGYNLGEFRLTSTHQNNLETKKLNLMTNPEDAFFKIQLSRGERFLIHSNGFEKSWAQSNNNEMINNILINKNLKSKDIVDELFFKVKQGTDSSFTDFDSSVVFMEVAKNAFIQL